MWDVLIQFLIQCATVIMLISFIRYYIDKRRIFQLGNKLPGPKPWPIVGNAMYFFGTDWDIQAIANRLNKKYGLAALWLGHKLNVFICTPEHAEIYFTSTKLLDHSEHLKFLEPAIGRSLLTANGSRWRRIRKYLEPTFRLSILKSYIPIMNKQSEIFVKMLEKETGKSSFSVFPLAKNCSFDIITETTMEVELKSQESEVKVLQNSDKLLVLIGSRMYKIWQHPDFLYKFSEDGKEFYSRLHEVQKFVNEQIKIKKQEYEKEKNLRRGKVIDYSPKGSILLHQLLEHGEWTDDELREHALTIITTGYETSSLTVCFGLIMLGLYPDVQEKLYRQIIIVSENESVDEDLQKLDYLDMVVKETLRLYPVASLLFRKTESDVLMGKYLIPKGAAVSMNIYALHRDPSQYENPNKFNPDNFLPEKVAKRHPYSYCPFGGGLRRCIGYKFAMMSVKIMLAKILRKYKVECDYKNEDDMELRFNMSIKSKDGFQIRLLNR